MLQCRGHVEQRMEVEEEDYRWRRGVFFKAKAAGGDGMVVVHHGGETGVPGGMNG